MKVISIRAQEGKVSELLELVRTEGVQALNKAGFDGLLYKVENSYSLISTITKGAENEGNF